MTLWGAAVPTLCRHGNVLDSSIGGRYAVACSDGVRRTAEVGQFQPNEVGVYDMIGNVAELILACAHTDDQGIHRLPAPEGSPELPSICSRFVFAMGSHWNSWLIMDYTADETVPARPLAVRGTHETRYYKSSETRVGFRLVRVLQD